MPPLLQVRGLSKAYAAPVLVDFDFELLPGEVHALVGSNGAGKSTFARILCGLVGLDAGSMVLGGALHMPNSMKDAERLGVVMVLQELNVIPTLSVAENIFVDRLPSRLGLIAYTRLRQEASKALARVGLGHISPDVNAGSLGVGQQQLVEIAAALARDCKVLILDEPTAALTDPEIQLLFENVRRLQNEGVGVIYISHRMDEIREIAQRVTVLRDGKCIATHDAKQVETSQLVREMAGHDLPTRPPEPERRRGEAVLQVGSVIWGERVRNVSFTAHSGEILGIAGLVGSGRSELLRCIYDASLRDSGRVYIEEQELFGEPDESVSAGMGLVPEDRKLEGLLLPQPFRVNLTLASLPKHRRALGWILQKSERRDCDLLGQQLKIRSDSTEQIVAELSGGNQQKIVIGRWLTFDCRVLLLDEPTRGVDAAAKDQIYTLLRDLAGQGKALVVVSSDLPELMSLCHRILVMSNGELTGEFVPETWTREAITEAAFLAYQEQS